MVLATTGFFSSVTFAKETFESQKENYITELRAENASPEAIACAENAKTKKDLKKCKKVGHETAHKEEAKKTIHN